MPDFPRTALRASGEREGPAQREGEGRSFVVAIDGPAASGKGTLARRIAERFGLAHLDTGALYRATALAVLDAAGEPVAADGREALRVVAVPQPRVWSRRPAGTRPLDRVELLVDLGLGILLRHIGDGNVQDYGQAARERGNDVDVWSGSQGQQPSDAAVALMLPSSRSADRNASRP